MNEKAASIISLVVVCHLHVPNDFRTADTSPIIADVGKPRQCEILNQEKFYGKGRCHCSLDNLRGDGVFSPQENQPSQPLFQ